MTTREEDARHLTARYSRLSSLCRMKAESSPNENIARELGELADAYERRRLRSI